MLAAVFVGERNAIGEYFRMGWAERERRANLCPLV